MAIFNEITGFVTPFDPRNEVRKRDFLDFKKQILTMRSKKEKTDAELIDIIMKSKSLYAKPRIVFTIMDVIRKVETKSKL